MQNLKRTPITTQSSRQFLTFTLGAAAVDSKDAVAGHSLYGIDLLSVQEIRGYTAATPIPNAAPYIKGAINLRGTVIPVLDLRIRFGMPDPIYTRFSVIIVVSIAGKTLGLVADGVSDVLDLPPSKVLPPPDFGPRKDSDCVEGIAEVEGGLVLILDLHRMLVSDGIVEAKDETVSETVSGQEAA